MQLENVIPTVKKAFERSALLKDRNFLLTKLESKDAIAGLVGEHPLFKNVTKMIFKVPPFDATVLITGESGTGKELVAKAIHDVSGRKDNPFIAINCAAIPENLIESELLDTFRGLSQVQTPRKRDFLRLLMVVLFF